VVECRAHPVFAARSRGGSGNLSRFPVRACEPTRSRVRRRRPVRAKNRCTRAAGHAVYRARYYNPYISRFINADPSGFNGGLNFYAFCNDNPISQEDPFGLQSWIGAGYGAIPLPHYGPATPTIGDPLSGLINYVTGGGQPVTIGEPLASSLQSLQASQNWPVTTTPQNMTFGDYASWSSPFSSVLVGLSLGQFRYANDGQTTTVNDTYAFPFSNTSPTGGTDYHNLLLSWIPGTPVPESGTWPTPNATPTPTPAPGSTPSSSQNSSTGK